MINKIKKIVNMVKNDLGYKKPNLNGEKVLFHKVIFHSYEEAIATLKKRNLAPGEMAVARYYVGYDDSTIPESWDYIRMILAIGGATPNSNEDVYFFKDFTDNGDESITFDDLDEKLSNYYTKDEIQKILSDDTSWQLLVNQRLNEIDIDINQLREDIKGINNIPDFNLNDYYTKKEVDEIINGIEMPDTTGFLDEEDLKEINKSIELKADKTSVKELEKELENKVDTSTFTESLKNKADLTYVESIESVVNNKVDTSTFTEGLKNKADLTYVEDIESIVNNKVDANYVDEYFVSNVESKVNKIINDINIPEIVNEEIVKQDIEGKISSAVDEKLKDIEAVTTESIDEVLQKNEYFTTNIITPIETINEQVKVIETQIKDLDSNIDGGEEIAWYMTTAKTTTEVLNALNINESVEIESDIHFNETIILDANANVGINVGDYSISKSGSGAAIRVNGGNLIIDGEQGHINGDDNGIETGDNQAVRCSNNGHIKINGGYFTVGDDGKNGGNSVIYCTEGIVEIYGGVFEYTGKNTEVGNKFVLNCQNANYIDGKAKIVVYGGTFMNGYNPAISYSDENGVNPTNFVAKGYKSVYEESNNSYIVVKE